MQRSPIAIAFSQPINLAMLAASVLAGLLAAWWLLPVGLLLWAVMLANVARSPDLVFYQRIQGREPLARRFQPLLERIQRAEIEVFSMLSKARGGTRAALKPVQDEVTDVADKAYNLLKRLSDLENYFSVTNSRVDLEVELRHVNDALPALTDPRKREEYEEKRLDLQTKLDALKANSSQVERMENQLSSVADLLDGAVGEVLNLGRMDAVTAGQRTPALIQRLKEAETQLDALSREMIDFRRAA